MLFEIKFGSNLRNTNLNFIEIFTWGICYQIKFSLGFIFIFCLTEIVFNYKKFLMILRHNEKVYWNFCIWSVVDDFCPKTDKKEMTFLVIDGIKIQWKSSLEILYLKRCKWLLFENRQERNDFFGYRWY